MNNPILKILGKRGRITIPWEIRRALGFAYNDVVSFEQTGDAVLVKREKICDNCADTPKPAAPTRTEIITELLDSLTSDELRGLLIHLTVLWAEMQTKGGDGDAGSAV